MIAYSLLEWPFNRNIDGLDPVWVSHPVTEHDMVSFYYAFPMIVHASSVTVIVRDKVAQVSKAPNHLPSCRNKVLLGFEPYIAKSVNIHSDTIEFMRGVNPTKSQERISVCYEKTSDYVYSPTKEFKEFISYITSKGFSTTITGRTLSSVPDETEECKDCNGEY